MKNIFLTLAIAATGYCSYAQTYLPLTAGGSNTLTGVLVSAVEGNNQIALNNPSANWGLISNLSTDVWSLGYGSSVTTQGTPVLSWNTSGNVGVGTTSPGALLHIFSSVAGMNTQLAKFEYLQPGAKGSGYISVLSGTRSTDVEQNSGDGLFRFGTYMDSNVVNNYTANDGPFGNINFVTGNGAGSSVAMTIGGGTQKGNIGIGTTNPQGYKLAVNGSAIATSMTVKLNSAWPDYVFKPAYHLPSLTEIKTYINQNHHLPEMPSEADVAKNGLNLGEIVNLQTKKIEELTLYLIEQQKINESLQSQINRLTKHQKSFKVAKK